MDEEKKTEAPASKMIDEDGDDDKNEEATTKKPGNPLNPQLKLQIKVKKCPTMKKVIMTKNTSRKMHSLNPKLKFWKKDEESSHDGDKDEDVT